MEVEVQADPSFDSFLEKGVWFQRVKDVELKNGFKNSPFTCYNSCRYTAVLEAGGRLFTHQS